MSSRIRLCSMRNLRRWKTILHLQQVCAIFYLILINSRLRWLPIINLIISTVLNIWLFHLLDRFYSLIDCLLSNFVSISIMFILNFLLLSFDLCISLIIQRFCSGAKHLAVCDSTPNRVEVGSNGRRNTSIRQLSLIGLCLRSSRRNVLVLLDQLLEIRMIQRASLGGRSDQPT